MTGKRRKVKSLNDRVSELETKMESLKTIIKNHEHRYEKKWIDMDVL